MAEEGKETDAAPLPEVSPTRRFIRALKPGFRPKWWDFLPALGVLLSALPLVAYVSWTDADVITVMGVAALVWLIGVPVSLLLLVFSWKSGTVGRVSLQLFLGTGVVGFLLLGIAVGVHGASIRESMRRGDEIVAAAEEFRAKHRRYPKSLSELEYFAVRWFQKPTVAHDWQYMGGRRYFRLRFSYGILSGKEYDSRIGRWEMAESFWDW